MMDGMLKIVNQFPLIIGFDLESVVGSYLVIALQPEIVVRSILINKSSDLGYYFQGQDFAGFDGFIMFPLFDITLRHGLVGPGVPQEKAH